MSISLREKEASLQSWQANYYNLTIFMAKTLILTRHSKAENRDHSISDINRPLTEEGRTDSFKMANLLLNSVIRPDLILSSSATRASQTAEIFSKILKTDNKDLNLSRKLYYCSAKTILDHIVGLPDNIKCVMVVAHNPGISDLVRGLSSGRVFFMENTQIIILEYDIDQWYNVGDHKPAVFHSHRVTDTPDNQKTNSATDSEQ
jgi:phosphohistidine phosphatase